jgi:DNA repair exonuclease SbcCD ATPase subunit
MSTSKKTGPSDPGESPSDVGEPISISDIAADFEAEVVRLEGITARIARIELTTDRTIQRAGELMKEAAESHERFLAKLSALIEAVDSARQRHNASAEVLSQCAQALEGRRVEYEAFQQRFAALGSEAREIIGMIQPATQESADPDGEAMLKRLRVARQRLDGAAESARALSRDARAANLTDLEREADAINQQLQSLSRKLKTVEPASGPTNGKGQA